MAYNDKVTINIKGHGEFQTTAMHFDDLIAEYLPASVHELRIEVLKLSGEGCEGHETTDGAIEDVMYCDGSCVALYRDLHTVTECLMYLAELTGKGTN